jgi:hypothetical protein
MDAGPMPQMARLIGASIWAYDGTWCRLLRRRAAAPGAETTTWEEDALARRDRSHLWGRAFIGPVGDFAEWVAGS